MAKPCLNGIESTRHFSPNIGHTSKTDLITGHQLLPTNGWIGFGPLTRPEYITSVSMGMIWKYFRGHMFSQINL